MSGGPSVTTPQPRLEEKVSQLKQLVRADGSLDCPLSPEFLLKFLRARKYNVQAAFHTLQRYYEMRTLYQDDFATFHPSALRHTLSSGIFTVLKRRDPHGRKILVFKTEFWDISKHSVNDIFLTSLLLGEEMLIAKDTQENGVVMIHDLRNLSLTHARQFSMRQIKKFVTVLQGAFPAKYKAIHVLHQPYIYNVLLAIAEPFLSKKFTSRIHLHGGDVGKMHAFVPPEILPMSLGGCAKEDEELVDTALMARLMKKDAHYRALLQYGYRKSTQDMR